MYTLNFISINDEYRNIFHDLMQQYAKELDGHQNRNTLPDILRKWTDSIIQKQHDKGRYLKLCLIGNEPIGFLYGKIDRADDKGYKQVGDGCIMEFYVLPRYRRMGYGRQMFSNIEGFFISEQATGMYLTADPVTGKPFWRAMGFTATGILSPDNGQEIFIKPMPT